MNKTQKIINIICVIALLCIIIFFIIPNRNNRDLNIKNINTVSTTTNQNPMGLKKIEYHTDFYDIKAEYENPLLDKEHIVENYVKKEVNMYLEDWKIGGDIQREEEQIAKDFPDRPKMKYVVDISLSRQESVDFGITSYIIEEYEYTGGAHGNTYIKTFNFDSNGKLIKISDILNINDKNIKDINQKIFKKVEEQGVEVLLNKETDSLSLENFIVENDNIIFVFGPYQVAAYSFGVMEIKFSYVEIKDYLIK